MEEGGGVREVTWGSIPSLVICVWAGEKKLLDKQISELGACSCRPFA